jgi:hypothetical protein
LGVFFFLVAAIWISENPLYLREGGNIFAKKKREGGIA